MISAKKRAQSRAVNNKDLEQLELMESPTPIKQHNLI